MNTSKILIACGMLILLLLAGGCAARGPLIERTGLVTLRGQPLTLQGRPLAVGTLAPAFTAIANDMSTYSFIPGGKVWLLTTVPSLDTPVCSRETRHFNEQAAALAPAVGLLTVSMDLPFAQKRWCGAEGIHGVQTLSDYRTHSCGYAWGVLLKENGLLARAVFVIGKDGRVKYAELVPEITHEPDYAAALAAAKKAAAE